MVDIKLSEITSTATIAALNALITEKFYEQDIVVSGVEQNVTIVPADADNYFVMTQAHAITLSQTGTVSGLSYVDLYYNNVNQEVLEYTIGLGVSAYTGAGTPKRFSGDYNLVVRSGALPTGITAATIKVIVKGFKIAK